MAKKSKRSEQGIELELLSGFKILIKPLPPYYKDLIDETIPMPEYPARKIELASGDSIDWEYKPPEIPLSTDDPDYLLYVKWKSVDTQRQIVEGKRKRARQDFLLSNCVKVVDGPTKLFEQEWAHNVEAAFPGYTIPTHPGKRLLVFLKTQVILNTTEMEMIVSLSTSPEANMQGILNALHGFQDKMAEDGFVGGNSIPAE